jgi:hypothetical protein
MVESIIIFSVFLALIITPLLFVSRQKHQPELDEDDTEAVEGTHFMKG